MSIALVHGFLDARPMGYYRTCPDGFQAMHRDLCLDFQYEWHTMFWPWHKYVEICWNNLVPCNILQQQNGVKLALDPEQLFFPGLRWCCAFASFACRKSGNCGPLGHFHTVAGLGASFRLGPGRLDTLHFPSKTQWLKMGVSINGGYP